MRSMTGFGRGESAREGVRIVVELKSVNRRQLEIALSLPRDLETLEPRLRERIGRDLSRGRVDGRVTLDRSVEVGAIRIDRTVASAYARELTALAGELGWKTPDSVEVLLRCPGVLGGEGGPAADPDLVSDLLLEAAEAAVSGLVAMRCQEGGTLASDLVARVAALRERHARIRERAPAVPARHRDLLIGRLRAAGLEGLGPDDERVLREVMLFAERCDISEELARLESHFMQFDRCLTSGEAVGRPLDFLAQEMHREINTVGTKAADADISAEVVGFKTELERFREQVQNIE